MHLNLGWVPPALSFFGKYLLATGKMSYSMELGFCATHVQCNRQARVILGRDGYLAEAALLEKFARQLDFGACWADSGWSCVHHYYDPEKDAGLLGRTPSTVLCRRYFQRALACWQAGHYRRAMFFLGAAGHLVQDAWEPHHASCRVGGGHSRYERWVQQNRRRYLAGSKGLYWGFGDVSDWVKAAACRGRELIELVSGPPDVVNYHQATNCLLLQAQRATAGFFLLFLERVGFTGEFGDRLLQIIGSVA